MGFQPLRYAFQNLKTIALDPGKWKAHPSIEDRTLASGISPIEARRAAR
jgi:hypothetical protein